MRATELPVQSLYEKLEFFFDSDTKNINILTHSDISFDLNQTIQSILYSNTFKNFSTKEYFLDDTEKNKFFLKISSRVHFIKDQGICTYLDAYSDHNITFICFNEKTTSNSLFRSLAHELAILFDDHDTRNFITTYSSYMSLILYNSYRLPFTLTRAFIVEANIAKEFNIHNSLDEELLQINSNNIYSIFDIFLKKILRLELYPLNHSSSIFITNYREIKTEALMQILRPKLNIYKMKFSSGPQPKGGW